MSVAVSSAGKDCTSGGLQFDVKDVEPPFCLDLKYLRLSISFWKYAEGLTSASSLALRSALTAESCSWGDKQLNAFQQPFTAQKG